GRSGVSRSCSPRSGGHRSASRGYLAARRRRPYNGVIRSAGDEMMRSAPVGRRSVSAPRMRDAAVLVATLALVPVATSSVFVPARPRPPAPGPAPLPAGSEPLPATGDRTDSSPASATPAGTATADSGAPLVRRITRPGASASPEEIRRIVEDAVRLEEGN